MRRALGPVTAVVVAAGILAGCGREQPAAPPAEKAAREQTKFFSQLAAKPDSPDALKGHFQTKFPDLDFRTWGSGAVPLRSNTGDPSKVHLELQLIASRKDEKSQNMEEAHPRILNELEAYLKALAKSGGAEIVGPVVENSKDGKKVGFRFGYKTPDNAGIVNVQPQEKVAGGLIVAVEEWE